MIETTIHGDDEGIRLDRWFKRHYPEISHGLLEKQLRKGQIRLDGKKAKSSDRVQAGQVVRVPTNPSPRRGEEGRGAELFLQRPHPSPSPYGGGNTPFPRKGKIRKTLLPETIKDTQRMVLYRDAHLIVINKPAGLATQGGTGIKDSVDHRLEALKFDLPEKPKLVHRLDKDTSGVLVLARNAKAAAKLMHAFAGKLPGERSSGVRSEPGQKIQKTYWALVVGCPKREEGKIDAPLMKREGNFERVGVDEEGKRALTHYRVIERVGKHLAWVELMPLTGRTHQLRVHMASLDCPILGDGKYGGRAAFLEHMDLPKQLHLHARRIILPSLFGKPIDVTAPLPEHMQKSWKVLGFQQE